MQLGKIELAIVPDATFRLDGGSTFGVVPRLLWEKEFVPDARNRIGLATNCLLVRGKDFVAVVDAGLGRGWDAKFRQIYEVGESGLPASLARHGVRPEDVDAVVVSHLHFDHVGAAVEPGPDGLRPAFPNATVYVQERELAHARSPTPRDRGSYRPERWEPLVGAGRLETISGERELRPGVTVVPLPGHSPGMQGVRIESEGKTAFFFADALPTAAHLPAAWTLGFDLDPIAVMEAKTRLTARAVRDGWLCVFVHDPRVPWGTIVEELGGKRRVAPVAIDVPEHAGQ